MNHKLDDIIVKELKNNGMFKATLIVDGQYCMAGGRRVYVKLLNDDSLKFFTRTSTSDKSSIEEDELIGFSNKLLQSVTGNIFCGVEFSLYTTLNDVTFKVVSGSSTIILESGWYTIGKMLQDSNKSISIRGTALPEGEASIIRKLFINKARKDYLDIAYGSAISPAIRRLLKKNKIYNMKPTAFVPIFIDVSYLYNPFKVEGTPYEQTAIYKYGVQHQRILKDDMISAMFLTHWEISKLSGLHNLVRFKHSTWANLFFGAMLGMEADLIGLPRKGANVYRWISDVKPDGLLKRVYPEQEFLQNVEEIHKRLGDDIVLYKKVDSVDSFLSDEYNSFRTVGALPIDDKISEDDILKYFKSFEILWEVNV